MSGTIFQVEIHIISKSVIIKAMIDGAFCTIFLIICFYGSASHIVSCSFICVCVYVCIYSHLSDTNLILLIAT